jgi:hypothetical protein
VHRGGRIRPGVFGGRHERVHPDGRPDRPVGRGVGPDGGSRERVTVNTLGDMTCPICAFPGNDPAAVRCANCGFAMRPPPPNPLPYPDPEPPVVAAYDVYPISGDPAPYPTGGWPQVGPVSAPPPVSGPPDAGFAPPVFAPPAPVRPQRSRVVVPLTVIVVVLVIASTVIAVVRMTGGSRYTPAAVGTTVSAGAGWVVPSPAAARTGAPPAARADPRAQAAAVDAVLDASGASRTKLNDAISLVGDCTLIEKAIADLRSVGVERQSQQSSVAAFDLSALPEGEQLRALLTQALGHSLAADRSFVLWGQAVQGSGCDGGGRGDYQEAQRQSRLASDAKTRFVGVWNPVAVRHGLRERAATEI